MNTVQKSKHKPQQNNLKRDRNSKVKIFTSEEEREFINSLLKDDGEVWTEEDEIKYQKIIERLEK